MINKNISNDKKKENLITFAEVTDILVNGDFDKFTSLRETEVFEAKLKKPYELPLKKAIIELIKDISSLANNKGGHIVCGLTTGKKQSSPHDYVTGLDLINKEDFYDEKQIFGLVTSNIYPRPDIKINWYPSSKQKVKGLGVITVPPQNEAKKYFLIKILEIDRETTREFFGVPIRTDDATKWLTVQELHKLSKRTPNNFQELYQSLYTQINEVKEMISTIPLMESINIDSIPATPSTDSILSKIEETIYGNK